MADDAKLFRLHQPKHAWIGRHKNAPRNVTLCFDPEHSESRCYTLSPHAALDLAEQLARYALEFGAAAGERSDKLADGRRHFDS